jgi:hypothetical protein
MLRVWDVQRYNTAGHLTINDDSLQLRSESGEDLWSPQPFSCLCFGSAIYCGSEFLIGGQKERLIFSSTTQHENFQLELRSMWKRKHERELAFFIEAVRQISSNRDLTEGYLTGVTDKMEFIKTCEACDKTGFPEAQESLNKLSELLKDALATATELKATQKGLTEESRNATILEDYPALDQSFARTQISRVLQNSAERTEEAKNLSETILEFCHASAGDIGFSSVEKVLESDMLETAPTNIRSFPPEFEGKILDLARPYWSAKRTDLPLHGSHAFYVESIFNSGFCTKLIEETEKLGYRTLEAEFEPTFRNNERVMVNSPALADTLWSVLAPLLERRDIFRTIPIGFGNSGTWKPVRLNECIKFSKYMSGTFFSPHIDGPWVPKWDEVSVSANDIPPIFPASLSGPSASRHLRSSLASPFHSPLIVHPSCSFRLPFTLW